MVLCSRQIMETGLCKFNTWCLVVLNCTQSKWTQIVLQSWQVTLLGLDFHILLRWDKCSKGTWPAIFLFYFHRHCLKINLYVLVNHWINLHISMWIYTHGAVRILETYFTNGKVLAILTCTSLQIHCSHTGNRWEVTDNALL